MKKIVLLGLLVLFLTFLPVTAQSDKLAGTWIEFYSDDFFLYRFSPDGSNLTIIDSSGYYPQVYSGTWETDGEKIIFHETADYLAEDYFTEIPYAFDGEKLILDWSGQRVCTRIDDSYFPEDPKSPPYLGEDKLYWISQLEDGTIQIDGYVGNEETVIVPDTVFGFPVTSIRETAFMAVEGLKHVVIPHGVTFIGSQAFSNNADLESVELPDTLRTLEYSAFDSCPNLKEIIIPEGITYLDADLFFNCDHLKYVVLPASIEAADEFDAFDYQAQGSILFFVQKGSFAEAYCLEKGYKYTALEGEAWERILQERKIPAELIPDTTDPDLVGTWIAFRNEDIIFFRFSPDGNDLTILECSAYGPELFTGSWEADGKTIFYDWAGYEKADELPYRFDDGRLYLEWYSADWVLDQIDDSFYPEDIDASPYLGENRICWISQTEEGTIRFDRYQGTEETFTVPETIFGIPVTEIGSDAFSQIAGLKHVIIPEGVTSIGGMAFAYSGDLESIQLPDKLKKIGYAAFKSCKSLKEIVIPEGVTSLQADTFSGCENLRSIVLPESLEEIDPDGAFDYNTMGVAVFTVAQGSYAEQYCRENGLGCVTPDGIQLTDGPVREADLFEEPVEETFDMPVEGVYSGPVYGDKDLYDKAMALYNEEKYFSARQAFIMSGYGDAEEWAEKCVQDWPSTGEIWHDRSQWLQDMELTIIVEQPEGTGMLIRVYKDNAPVSYLFLSGSDTVTVRLPGNGYYEIRDGVGYNWYGLKEAFGGDGRYETMTFDENGTQRVYLQSYYAYTLSINVRSVDPTGDDVYSESIDWSKFVVE